MRRARGRRRGRARRRRGRRPSRGRRRRRGPGRRPGRSTLIAASRMIRAFVDGIRPPARPRTNRLRQPIGAAGGAPIRPEGGGRTHRAGGRWAWPCQARRAGPGGRGRDRGARCRAPVAGPGIAGAGRAAARLRSRSTATPETTGATVLKSSGARSRACRMSAARTTIPRVCETVTARPRAIAWRAVPRDPTR